MRSHRRVQVSQLFPHVCGVCLDLLAILDEGRLHLVDLEALLVHNVVLDVVVSLHDLGAFSVFEPQPLVQGGLAFLSKYVHFDLHFLGELVLGVLDLLGANLHVVGTLHLLHLRNVFLDDTGLLVSLLLGEHFHLPLEVEQSGAVLELQRKRFLKLLPMLLKLNGLAVCKLLDGLLVGLLGLDDLRLPLLVEVQVMLSVRLLELFPKESLVHDELSFTLIVVLLSHISDALLGLLGLIESTALLAIFHVVFQTADEISRCRIHLR